MKYCYWLSNMINLSNAKKISLTESGITAQDIYYMSRFDLSELNILTERDIKNISDYKKENNIDELWMRFLEKNINFVTVEQDNFPEKLKYISNCPYCIFYIGKLPDNDEKTIGIVGARARSVYGREVALTISQELVNAGYSVISGLAQGIDGDAHRGALNAGGNTYGVLASGVDVCYPEKNRYIYEEILKKQKGGIISENIPGTKAKPMFFPLRNRIISGLSDGIVVVEAREKSGSLISADYAIDQGKDVFVVPGRITDELSAGCNKLIFQGAHIILSPEDLLLQLKDESVTNYKKKNLRKILLEKEETLVYSLLDFRPIGLINLVDELNFDLSKVLEIIESLENKGYVEEIIPNFYVKVL